MEQFWHDLKPVAMLGTLIYSIIGLAIFAAAFWIMQAMSPFSLRKEIEQDQNVALAITMGSVFVSLAIIIQAAIR